MAPIKNTPMTLVPTPQGYREKDTLVGDPMAEGHLYRTGGFWSMCADEVISSVIDQGSQLMDWLPSRGVDTVNSNVAHLSWVGPEGFDGSQTYQDYLAELAEVDECGYGPSDDYNGFEYSHSGFSVSRTSRVLKPEDFGSLRWCERQPQMRVRGSMAGNYLQNDAEWAMARAGMNLKSHLNWNIVHGDPTVAEGTYDGLDVIIQPGWVSSKIVGGNPAVFADPLVVNGASLTTPEAVLTKIKGMVRKIRRRASQRGYILSPNDYAIVMTSSHWTYIADAIAHGSMMAVAPNAYTVNITPEGFQRERARITSGFYGNGFIDVDSQPVPVLIEDQLGANGMSGDDPVVTGDIYILTRYFAGITILEHQWRNWNAMQGYPHNGTDIIQQNGMLRVGWLMVNNKCFQYYAEMNARLLSTFQPLQGRINNVTVETILENENEGADATHLDWYALDGLQAGGGVALVEGAIGS